MEKHILTPFLDDHGDCVLVDKYRSQTQKSLRRVSKPTKRIAIFIPWILENIPWTLEDILSPAKEILEVADASYEMVKEKVQDWTGDVSGTIAVLVNKASEDIMHFLRKYVAGELPELQLACDQLEKLGKCSCAFTEAIKKLTRLQGRT